MTRSLQYTASTSLRRFSFLGILAAAVLFGGCTAATTRPTVSRIHDRGDFKPIGQVAPHARAMVEGRMGLPECLQQPESIADGGRGCITAIRDLPAPLPR
ncbi:MAG: hypothetical protein NTY46_04640 [Candidatus Sumerlaeota bacterium]|nr:hypothetical protein [Candidatus Sumerlaeota bacterium]